MHNLRQRQQSQLSPQAHNRSHPLHGGAKKRRRFVKGSNGKKNTIIFAFAFFIVSIIGVIYSLQLKWLFQDDAVSQVNKKNVASNQILGTTKQRQTEPKQKAKRYQDWKEIAIKLATMQPSDVLEHLESDDPFGTRKFDQDLIQEETRLKRNLNLDEIQTLFTCPVDRITLPDLRSNEKAQAFRDGEEGSFLFFQHLRKAGGTHFCSLAEKNLDKSAISRYYCMPDREWNEQGSAGYLHSYTNDQISQNMKEKGYRIAGNEWDQFRIGADDGFFNLPALFATSFRKPLDRAVSQFRFECLEDRGCHIATIEEYWEKRSDLKNVYTYTFSDHRGRLNLAYHGTDETKIAERVMMLSTALDTVIKFDLVLAMEWLSYAGPLVQSVLGFKDTTQLTHRVRPHVNQSVRNDGQEENKMGSASIKKASYDAKEYLSPEQYKKMSLDLALDEILTDAARRIFLERLVCSDI